MGAAGPLAATTGDFESNGARIRVDFSGLINSERIDQRIHQLVNEAAPGDTRSRESSKISVSSTTTLMAKCGLLEKS